MKKKSVFCRTVVVACTAALVLTFGGVSSYAADRFQTGNETATMVSLVADKNPAVKPVTPAPTKKSTPTPKPKNGLIKEKSGYRYYVKNKPLKSTWKKISNRYYWFKSNGYAAQNGSCLVKGKYYVFDEKARRLAPKKSSVVKVKTTRYFVTTKGTPVSAGWREYNGKMYYVYKDGKCAANKTVEGIKCTKDGYASNLNQVKCKLAARKFIAQHTTSKMTKEQKLRACFNYIVGYNRFVGNMSPTKQEFKTKTWVYKYGLQMFQNGLTGNCYGISSSFAAVAKELGYQPYVITIPEGHGFVMINGRYYDNMYGALFNASTRPAYKVLQKIKF